MGRSDPPGLPARARSALVPGAAFAACAIAAGAAGEEFAWEISGGGKQLEVGDTVETDRRTLGATYFFPPAEDMRGPYALAAFLSRRSYIGLAMHRDEEVTTLELSSPTGESVTSVSETETEIRSIAGRHVLPGSGWYAGAGYHAGDSDPPSSPILERDTEIEGYSVHFGRYIGTSTSLEMTWSSTESTTEVVSFTCVAPFCLRPSGHEITGDEAALRVIHVGTIGTLDYSVSGAATSHRTDVRLLPAEILGADDDVDGPAAPFGSLPVGIAAVAAPPVPSRPSLGRFRRYAGAFEAFPTARLGARARYARWDGESQLEEAYEVSLEWFFLRNVSARLKLARTERDTAVDEWDETDSVDLTLTGRF